MKTMRARAQQRSHGPSRTHSSMRKMARQGLVRFFREFWAMHARAHIPGGPTHDPHAAQALCSAPERNADILRSHNKAQIEHVHAPSGMRI